MDGRLPETARELRALPGIGEYTSGAIASLAFGERVPAVDGNVRRVLSRVLDLDRPTAAELVSWAAELVSFDRPGDWNEALMEFGATVCLPKAPPCEACPLGEVCLARAAGTVALRPSPRRNPKIRDVAFDVVVPVRSDGAIFTVRRPSTGLLGGLWEFPQVEIDDTDGKRGQHRDGRANAVDLSIWGLEVGSVLATMEAIPHVFTHLRATYRPTVVSASGGRECEEARWFYPTDLSDLPLPVAQRKILAGIPRLTA